MKKEVKSNISISLGKELLRGLDEFCEKNYSVRSKVIEHAIKEFLRKGGKS